MLSSQPMVHHSDSGGMAASLLLPARQVVHHPFPPSQVDSISLARPVFAATAQGKWRLSLGLYQLRQAEGAARKKESQEQEGQLGRILSAIAEGKGGTRQWVRMERAVERRGEPGSWLRRVLANDFRGGERDRVIRGVAG